MITAKEACETARIQFELALKQGKEFYFEKIMKEINLYSKSGSMFLREETTGWHSSVLEYIKEKLSILGYTLREDTVNNRNSLVISWEKEIPF